MPDDEQKIHIDSDWKAEAQRERERLAQQSKAAAAAGGTAPAGGGTAPSASRGASGATSGGASGGGGRQLPKASFETLVSQTATQALLFMGAIPDPRSGQRIQHMDLARHHIDMLGVIDEKTRGNLSDEEAQMLAATLYELRQRYIAVSQAMRQK